jgi:serine protease
VARTVEPHSGRRREALDPDDFSGGFGVWSGTSFSAPIAAGAVARALLDQMSPAGEPDDVATATAKARRAIEVCLAEE